ncbi:peptidase S41 [Campylobacter sp. MIT 97-5078]|nr:peptidase S41 [Campylobacter sp. MIT 97-5078]
MKIKAILMNILGFTSTLLICFFLISQANAKPNESYNKDQVQKRLDALEKYTKTLAIVEQYYVDDENVSDLIDKSLSGLLSNLDAHSSFLNEKEFQDLKIQTSGEFGGLGISVGMKDGALSVIAPIEGTPADRAGIKAGDVILRIDGEATLGMSLNDAVDKMRGKPKSTINITIYRKGSEKPFDIKLTREIIKIESVYSKLIENEDILYLRVTSFDKKVSEEAKKQIQKNPKIKGIVLDLRNNPGGLLDQAVGLTNLFVDKGVIVSQKGKNEADNKEYPADPRQKVTDVPLVVLVNEGSASASEIVSGALQDLKRAIIIGTNTFGKGSVQSIIPLSNTQALRLTVARYYLSSGRTIQAVGVKPDIEVLAGKVNVIDNNFSIKENDLKLHLESELEKIQPNEKKTNSKTDKNIITQAQIYDDAQLKSAIDAIKVLNIKG